MNQKPRKRYTPSVTFSDHDLLGRPGTVTETRPGGIADTTTLSHDPVSGPETAAYAANHSVLPGVTLEARAPDEHGHPIIKGQAIQR